MLNPDYPRPQLQRRRWQPLDGRWQFAWDDQARHAGPKDNILWRHEIQVPFPPGSKASGLADGDAHTCCWCQRTFAIDPGNGRVLLHFGAVGHSATVWINDVRVATHEGGHTPFSVDITDVLTDSGTQRIAVRAKAETDVPTAGRRGGGTHPPVGIWQTVWLETVPAVRIGGLRWTPDADRFEFGLDVDIGGQMAGDLSLEVVLRSGGRILLRDSCRVDGREVRHRIRLPVLGAPEARAKLLWSPDHPVLIDAELTLRQNDVLVDKVWSYTALRSVGTDGQRLLLNGQPCKLRMVRDAGVWPDTGPTPPSGAALRRDVELAKALGFNGVRKRKIEDPRYLYWADRLGLLVWTEMETDGGSGADRMARHLCEWTRAVMRDYSHPCVVAWTPCGEAAPERGGDAHRARQALYHLTRTLDPTRPVMTPGGWQNGATDIIGVDGRGETPASLEARYGDETSRFQLFERRRRGGRVLTLNGYPHRGHPVVLTDFGYVDWHAGGTENDGEAGGLAPIDQYRAWLSTASDLALLSGFCYAQLYDTADETDGLLTADRTPKAPQEMLREAMGVSSDGTGTPVRKRDASA